jgi:hypothetical protein
MSASHPSSTATTVHVSGPRPTAAQLVHELRDFAVARPLFVASPLVRRWHRRWGASLLRSAFGSRSPDLIGADHQPRESISQSDRRRVA